MKNILSEEKINWREVNKSQLIGYDVDDNIGVDITHDINTKAIIVKLEKTGELNIIFSMYHFNYKGDPVYKWSFRFFTKFI